MASTPLPFNQDIGSHMSKVAPFKSQMDTEFSTAMKSADIRFLAQVPDHLRVCGVARNIPKSVLR